MGVRAYNRGSRAIRAAIDRDLAERRLVRATSTPKFWATIEYLSDRRAILSVFETDGTWSGAARIDGRNRRDLYEEGYKLASGKAFDKGGRLDRYVVDERCVS